jgi:hypothetical protein
LVPTVSLFLLGEFFMAVAKKTKSVGEIAKSVESSISLNETNSDMARLTQMASTIKNLKSVLPSDVSKEIGELKMFCTSSLDSLSNNIITKVSMLEDIDKAISFQQENLDRVHKITVAASTLESLLLAQEVQRKEFEAEVNGTKQLWLRDQNDYKYEQSLIKRKDADDFEAFKKGRIAALEEVYKDKMKEVLERDAALREMKSEYDTAIGAAQGFDSRLGYALTEQEKVITERLTKDFNYQLRMSQKDAENAAKLANQTISSQQSRIVELERAIAEVRAQENKATERVQQIAEKAIENASKSNTVIMPNNQSEQNSFTENKRGK